MKDRSNTIMNKCVADAWSTRAIMDGSFSPAVLRFVMVLLLTALVCGCDGNTNDITRPAVKNLPEGWTHDVLYANTCVSPVGMTVGEDGYMYINERCGYRILRLAADGSISDWAYTSNLEMDSIFFQQNLGRLIGISDSTLYKITSNDTTMVGSFSDGLPASTMIIDPRDDSIYAVAWESDTDIRHYDQDFNLIKKVQSVDYCLNIALDYENDILYFTQSAAGTVTSLNLLSGETKVIRENLGTGSYDENLGVAVDGNGLVYYSSYTDGLFKYVPSHVGDSTEEKVMDIPLGVGSIYWWSTGQAILQTNVFAGTVVKMDPNKSEPELMEPNVNTDAIVARSNGKLFFYTLKQLSTIEDGAVTEIGDKLELTPGSLALDHEDNMYVSFSERTIYKVDPSNGSLKQHIVLDDGNVITRIEYDFYNNEMVALSLVTEVPPAGEADGYRTGSAGSEVVAIWRTSVAIGSTPRRLATIELEESHDSAIMVNRNKGDIYFYNRTVNKLTKLNEATGTLETIYENVVDPKVIMVAGLNFFSPLDGFVVTYNEVTMELWPVDGSGKKGFADSVCGMDSAQGYEDANGHYIAAHSGQIFRIRPCVENEDCYQTGSISPFILH